MADSSVDKLWLELKSWYSEHLPQALDALNPGATEQSIAEMDDELENIIGQGLPQELRNVYAQNDGQSNDEVVCGVLFGLEFLSLAEMKRVWRDWYDLAQSMPELAKEPGTSHPPSAILAEYINIHRIPFASDGSGNHLGIDLQPGLQGRIGQVINYGADEKRKFVVAPSFKSFLAWTLEQYRVENFHVITEQWGETPAY